MMLGGEDAGQEAHRGFVRARRREVLGRWVRRLGAGLRGSGSDVAGRLACFGEASGSSGVLEECCRGFEIVEVARISGSVGRCADFDRGFLPACSCLGDRWRGVHLALRKGKSLPPVELYKLGGEFFVLDGNHRVSVARYRGIVAVDAMVTGFLAPCGC
ncbi:hypothetical protein GBA65_19500 [Rubrobacter marinus]|uniref:ParB/Sulfiredoxin domain-containing protein n=1 Tax=Rubrobacter marinus TaxID=2653852 RepID=A0A6G8Q1J4_9ACTN|nr:hypothetical protein [Rubrobacter marinus]QIN80342.1 hypothetical protein GBA65_19500 [Rubrobacter marinus]